MAVLASPSQAQVGIGSWPRGGGRDQLGRIPKACGRPWRRTRRPGPGTRQGLPTPAGARNVVSVLDARMRKIVDPLVPLPQKPWTGRPREFPDPEVREYVGDRGAWASAR